MRHRSWPMAKLLLGGGNELISHELRWGNRREIPEMSGFFFFFSPVQSHPSFVLRHNGSERFYNSEAMKI